MNSAIMSKEQVSSYESASAFQALEWSFFGMGSFMPASVFASTECTIAELAFVFLLRGQGTLLCGMAVGGGGSHCQERATKAERFNCDSTTEMRYGSVDLRSHTVSGGGLVTKKMWFGD